MEVELLETGPFSSASLAGIPFAMSLYVRERLRAAAAVVAFSRVYSVHYPGDVIAGATVSPGRMGDLGGRSTATS
jgi:hypothetical protein